MRLGDIAIGSFFKTKFIDRLWRNSVFVLFTVTLLATIKVTFGGDWKLVTLDTLFNASLLLVVISIGTGLFITLWEKSHDYSK